MVTEKQIDLFKEIEIKPCCILHCISADRAMGAGIAKPLQEKFHIRENWPRVLPERLTLWQGKGYSVFVNKDSQLIGNLITKEHYWDKPTYETLREALTDAYYTLDNLNHNGFDIPNKIVMPRIGCGLDKLDWNKVKQIIEEIFEGFDITVCYL